MSNNINDYYNFKKSQLQQKKSFIKKIIRIFLKCWITKRVSEPPTILNPSPILSLFISIVDSVPGVMGAVAGSAGGSSMCAEGGNKSSTGFGGNSEKSNLSIWNFGIKKKINKN